MPNDRGFALLLALLVMSFLTVLGGALLTTSTVDIWISDNFRNSTQSLYLAEAGISHARELLRSSPSSPTELLVAAAGPDQQLLTPDDQPLISSRPLIDAFGQPGGFYEVRLSNDTAEAAAGPLDGNNVLTLISLGQIGTSRKTLEVTIIKGGFPDTATDPRLTAVRGIENLASAIARNATDNVSAPALQNAGNPTDYRVIVANGNLDLGPGTGYGILLVRGELTIVGNITWNGLILVIGQGVVRWAAGVTGQINGGLFVAATRAADGTLLSTPSGITYTVTDTAQIRAANRPFPYNPIGMKEK